MRKIYVIDTNALIFFFAPIFKQASRLSNIAREIIEIALKPQIGGARLSIPSVVFIEIYRKWIRDEEFAKQFYYEVFLRCSESPNVEIKKVEREVLENLLAIGGSLLDHDIHDKLILASAMTLQCPLITTDNEIIRYVAESGCIPQTLS